MTLQSHPCNGLIRSGRNQSIDSLSSCLNPAISDSVLEETKMKHHFF